MISDDILSDVNNNILIKRNNIRNGFDSDFRNGKDYLDQIGRRKIEEKLNINIGSFVEPFDEDDTNEYLYKTLNNYSDEPLTFEAENAAGCDPSTYGKMRMNAQYTGSKYGALPKFYKDFNSNFKREKIDRTYAELGDINKEMGSRVKKFQAITYNNDSSNFTLSGERQWRDVIKDRRKFDKLLTERFRTITRDDDDIGGYNRGRQLSAKQTDESMVESGMVIEDPTFNTKLSAIALHYSPYSNSVKNTIQDLKVKSQLESNNRQYSTHAEPVDRSNYIADVRLKDSLMQYFTNKYNISTDKTMKQEHFDSSAKMGNSLMSGQTNGYNINSYTNIPTETSMKQSILREDMAKIFKNKVGKFQRMEQDGSMKKSLLSEQMGHITKTNIKNGRDHIRNAETYVNAKDSMMTGVNGINVSSLVLTPDGYEIPVLKDITKSVNNTALNHEKYTNLDTELSALYDINAEQFSLGQAQLNINNKTALDREYTQDAVKYNLRSSDTFINRHVSTSKKYRALPFISHENPVADTF